MDHEKTRVMICTGQFCSSGGMQIASEFEQRLSELNLLQEVKVIRTGCLGMCSLGPVVIIRPEGVIYTGVQSDYVSEIISEHLLNGTQP